MLMGEKEVEKLERGLEKRRERQAAKRWLAKVSLKLSCKAFIFLRSKESSFSSSPSPARSQHAAADGVRPTGASISTRRTRLAESRVTKSTSEGFRRGAKIRFVSFLRHRSPLAHPPKLTTSKPKKKKKKKKHQAGTDGNDHAFRMTVDKKYTELPARRKAARKAASACAVLAALRTLWCVAVPTAAGVAFPATALAVAAAALAASFLRAAGSGFGVPHKEKLALLKLHAGPAVAALVATQLAALAVDHGLTPKERRRPAQLVAALSSLSSSPSSLPSPAAVETVEKCVEGALDAALLAAAVASAVAGRRYLRMKQAK